MGAPKSDGGLAGRKKYPPAPGFRLPTGNRGPVSVPGIEDSPPVQRCLMTTAWAPMVDIFEEPDQIRIVAEIPGIKPEDVKISVEGNLLTISGMTEQVAEEAAEKVHRYERTYGAFERTFRLSTSIDANRIKAT